MKIINIELITLHNPLWKPIDLSYIKNLHLKAKPELFSSADLEITFLSPNGLKGFLEIIINFEGISSLKIDLNGMRQILGFDIIDISNNGWEEINYEIEDYENGKINFFCKEIKVISVFKSEVYF